MADRKERQADRPPIIISAVTPGLLFLYCRPITFYSEANQTRPDVSNYLDLASRIVRFNTTKNNISCRVFLCTTRKQTHPSTTLYHSQPTNRHQISTSHHLVQTTCPPTTPPQQPPPPQHPTRNRPYLATPPCLPLLWHRRPLPSLPHRKPRHGARDHSRRRANLPFLLPSVTAGGQVEKIHLRRQDRNQMSMRRLDERHQNRGGNFRLPKAGGAAILCRLLLRHGARCLLPPSRGQALPPRRPHSLLRVKGRTRRGQLAVRCVRHRGRRVHLRGFPPPLH